MDDAEAAASGATRLRTVDRYRRVELAESRNTMRSHSVRSGVITPCRNRRVRSDFGCLPAGVGLLIQKAFRQQVTGSTCRRVKFTGMLKMIYDTAERRRYAVYFMKFSALHINADTKRRWSVHDIELMALFSLVDARWRVLDFRFLRCRHIVSAIISLFRALYCFGAKMRDGDDYR